MKDFQIVNGQIVPRKNDLYEYGERWLYCKYCNCKRPVDKLEPDEKGQDVQCKSRSDCHIRPQ